MLQVFGHVGGTLATTRSPTLVHLIGPPQSHTLVLKRAPLRRTTLCGFRIVRLWRIRKRTARLPQDQFPGAHGLGRRPRDPGGDAIEWMSTSHGPALAANRDESSHDGTMARVRPALG